jgi:hypothetical protein
MITAPHELHLTELQVTFGTFVTQAMRESGLTADAVRELLWRAYLDLARQGDSLLVEKTPSNAFFASEIAQCWPGARAIVLRRDPRDTWQSFHQLTQAEGLPTAEAATRLRAWMDAVDHAARVFAGRATALRYEDLVREPIETLDRLVAFLALPAHEFDGTYRQEGPFAFGVGDFGPEIRSGKVGRIRSRSHSADIPEEIRAKVNDWGYE